MDFKILKEEKDTLELQFEGESHTFCNLLRKELWENENVVAASYNLKHPLLLTPTFILQVKSGKPRKFLVEAADALKKKTKELKAQVSKLK